jgi:hypothetical protein
MEMLFNENLIRGNELLFWILNIIILIMISITFYLGYKEVNKNENK